MSLGIELINILKNPFFILEMILEALDYYPEDRKITILDAYIVGTLILKKDTRAPFHRKTVNSTLTKVFDNENKFLLNNLERDINSTKSIINKAIIIGVNQNRLELKDGFVLRLNKDIERSKKTNDYIKISRSIGKVLGKYSLVEILNFMGVKNI